MRSREIALRVFLLLLGAGALALTAPASLHGWDIPTKQVTQSYVYGAGSDMSSDTVSEGDCDSPTFPDGALCVTDTLQEPVTDTDRVDNAILYGIVPLFAGAVLVAFVILDWRTRKA